MAARLKPALEAFRSVPEQALLLELSGLGLSDAGIDACRRTLERRVRWEPLLRLALRHGTLPLVCRNLADHFEELVPAEILQDWVRRCREGIRRRLLLARELVLLMRAFEQEGIAAMAFKGPTLAQRAYGNLALRPFEDLDILVSPGQTARAKALLLRRGARYRWAVLSPARERAAVRAQYHLEFLSGESSLPVELHWRLFPAPMPDPFDPDRLIRRPEPEDLFLMLAAHAAKHRYARLIWLVDAAALLEAPPPVRWDRLMEEARRLGLRRALLVFLLLTRDLLNRPLPAAAERRLPEDPALEALAAEAFQGPFRAEQIRDGGWEEFRFLFRIRERWRDRVGHVLRQTLLLFKPTSEEWDRFPLPDPLFFLYYGIRPLRLAWEYAPWR